MRILMNVNNLLLCSQSHSIKSTSRLLRWNSPCTASISVAGSNRLFSTVPSNLCKSFPKLMIYQNVQNRLISSSSLNCKNNTNKAAASFDDDDPDGVSVYEGKYTKQILRVKMFSLTTSAMGLVAQPVLWQKGIEVSGTGLSVLICSVAGIFTFVTPLLLHFVTKKYVIDIKYNEKTDEYTCITISFFLFKNRTKFKVEDVHLPEVETMFTSMKIGPKKVAVFVDAASFTDTHHYARFMRYDKPMDIRLDVDEINQIENSKLSHDKVKATQPDK